MQKYLHTPLQTLLLLSLAVSPILVQSTVARAETAQKHASSEGAKQPAGTIPVFTDVTAAAGLDTNMRYSFGGPIWGDYDADGNLDLYTDDHYYGPPFFYHNNGNGTFSNVILSSGIRTGGDKHGAAWVDFDNDGDLDLFQTKGAGEGHLVGAHMDEFYQNLGNSTFVDIGSAAGVTDPNGRGRSVAWADINNDGYPDMIVGDLMTPLVLFLNNGDGTFTDITAAAGLANLQYIEVAFADYDNDGYPDLFMTNASSMNKSPDLLWHNNGNGTFTNVSAQAGVAPLMQGRSIAWGDYDNDGYLDLFISRGSDDGAYKQTLYHNNRNGTFTDVTKTAKLSAVADNREACWGDFDNDGYLDLYVVNSGSDPVGKGPNYLYHNNGNGTFTDVAATAGVQVNVASRGRGACWGDYNNDGFLDLFVTNGEDGTDFEEGPKILFKNGGNTNSWLKIILVGTISNRQGLGAKVSVQSGSLSEYRENNGASGHYLSQDAAPLLYGLGANTTANVTVKWPSGIIDTLTNVAARTTLTIVEGSTN